MRIGILLFDDVDVLDVGGPYEVLLTASRLVARTGADPPFEVVTVSIDGQPVTAYGGMGLVPQATVAEVPDLDVVVVPGAIAIEEILDGTELVPAIRDLADRGPVMASVCTGAFLLDAAGLLEDRDWTTHWEDIDTLAGRAGGMPVRAVRWVDAGEVVTAGGLSAGIAMALHLVDRFAGRDLATRTARQLDYDWDPADGAPRPRAAGPR